MKNLIIMLLSLSVMLSCSERTQTSKGRESTDQMDEVESPTQTDLKEEPEPIAESFGLIGKWTIPSSFGGGELKIEHHLGKYYKNEELSDGTVNISEMELMEEDGVRIFSVKDKSSNETWAITESGGLEVRGKDGQLYSSQPI